MRDGKLSEFIAYEVGFNKLFSSDYFGINFSCEYRTGDHEGFFFRIYICSFGFEFNVYDVRHEDE